MARKEKADSEPHPPHEERGTRERRLLSPNEKKRDKNAAVPESIAGSVLEVEALDSCARALHRQRRI
jgi:hypothetical protein